MASYAPLDVDGMQWGVVTKEDLEEAIVPELEGETDDYYANFIEEYGYYDLFLINPDGFVFYSVAKEADYQTNVVDGEYADSSLGQAVRESLGNQGLRLRGFRALRPLQRRAGGLHFRYRHPARGRPTPRRIADAPRSRERDHAEPNRHG